MGYIGDYDKRYESHETIIKETSLELRRTAGRKVNR